ncbi:MAG: substrate-binding domain-containing protein, partial [Dermatophilaceae bacterium]
ATYSPSPFDKGSTITVVLASGSDLAKPIEAALTTAEFGPDMRVGASGADQHDKTTAILASPPKVLVVDAMDEDAIRDDLNTAQEAGAVVIALSSLPKDTKAFDFYVGADPQATGKLQGQAPVDGVRCRVEKAAPEVELFAGPPTDAAAQMRFDAARDVIGPAVDAKTVEVGSRATMVKELSEGKEPTLNHKDDVDNGAEAVPAHLLTPTIVRRGDAATIFAKNATLKALVTP